MVEITHDQDAIAVQTNALQADAQYLLELIGYPDFDLGIVLTTPEKIQAFNRTFRHKDAVTDILSFAYYPNLKPGERITLPAISPDPQDEKYLGDIIICPAFANDDLPNWRTQTFDQHMQQLLVHGVCHLLGYDHETESEAADMHDKEEELLNALRTHNKQ